MNILYRAIRGSNRRFVPNIIGRKLMPREQPNSAIQSIGTPHTDNLRASARQFHSVAVDDRVWEKLWGEGYRVLVKYATESGYDWTMCGTFHPDERSAHYELLEVLTDGIVDIDANGSFKVLEIVIQRFPIVVAP